jgi:putative inorganic carbon (HCO3(-)) transporter
VISQQNTTMLNWKHLIVPALACVAFCILLLNSEGNNIPVIIGVSALPLLAWLFFARTHAVLFGLFALIPVSIPYKTGEGIVIGLPSEALLALLGVYLLLMHFIRPVFTREILRHPLVILVLCELTWMLFCSIFSTDPTVSLKRVIMRSLFVQVFLLFGIHTFLRNEKRISLLFLLYACGMIWPVIKSYLSQSEMHFSRAAAYKMCIPFYTDHTIYGACLAFLIPTLLICTFGNQSIRLRGYKHALVVVLTVILIAALILSFSRAAWISVLVAFAFGGLLMLRIKMRSIVAFLLIAGACTYVFSDQIYQSISENDSVSTKGDLGDHLLSSTNVQSDASNTERINRWVCAWRMALDKPFTGYGPGTYQFEYGRFQDRGHMTRISTFNGGKGHAHSEYFTQLSETGFPGALIFLAIVLAVIGYGMKVIYSENDKRNKLFLYGAVLGLITFYVHGIFNAFLDSDKMAVLVFGSIAVIVAADLRQQQKATSR